MDSKVRDMRKELGGKWMKLQTECLSLTDDGRLKCEKWQTWQAQSGKTEATADEKSDISKQLATHFDVGIQLKVCNWNRNRKIITELQDAERVAKANLKLPYMREENQEGKEKRRGTDVVNFHTRGCPHRRNSTLLRKTEEDILLPYFVYADVKIYNVWKGMERRRMDLMNELQVWLRCASLSGRFEWADRWSTLQMLATIWTPAILTMTLISDDCQSGNLGYDRSLARLTWSWKWLWFETDRAEMEWQLDAELWDSLHTSSKKTTSFILEISWWTFIK